METSFCELKGKEVINVVDGKRLGKIIDIVFDTKFGRVLGIVVPSYNKSWNIFKASDDIFIPFNCICKFGDDAILVQIYVPNQNQTSGKKGRFIRTASSDAVAMQADDNHSTNQNLQIDLPLYPSDVENYDKQKQSVPSYSCKQNMQNSEQTSDGGNYYP